MIVKHPESPFFIIGNPRSGTTLLRLALHNHPRLGVAPECGFALWLFDRYREKSEDWWTNLANLEAFCEDVVRCKKFDTWRVSKEEILVFMLEHGVRRYQHATTCVYLCYMKKCKAEIERWGDKNNFYLNKLDELERLYPRGKLVHIVRDGRDVACSYADMHELRNKSRYSPNLPSDIYDAIIDWSKNQETIEASLRGCSLAYYEVKYEDIVSRPEAKLSEICQFLSVRYNPAMLKFYESNKRDQQEPRELMAWKQKTLEPISRDRVGRYRKLLPGSAVAELTDIARKWLVKFGYPVD